MIHRLLESITSYLKIVTHNLKCNCNQYKSKSPLTSIRLLSKYIYLDKFLTLNVIEA